MTAIAKTNWMKRMTKFTMYTVDEELDEVDVDERPNLKAIFARGIISSARSKKVLRDEWVEGLLKRCDGRSGRLLM